MEELLDLFHYNQINHQDLPIAALTALVDLENPKGNIWMRADPVFLHADLTSLILFDSQSFSLTKKEAKGLLLILNPVLAEDGLRLICGDDPARWYLRFKEKEMENVPSITTVSPRVVNGRDIRSFLPEGKDGTYWVRLANEIQMLLHDCSINQERQRRGEVPINSVWFWGNGKLLEQKVTSFDQVISNDVNAQGLAIHAGVPHVKIPADFNRFLNEQEKDQNVVIVLSQGDLALSKTEVLPEDQSISWQEQTIFDPLLSNLKKGRIQKLEIISDDQHRIVKPSHLYRFWRK